MAASRAAVPTTSSAILLSGHVSGLFFFSGYPEIWPEKYFSGWDLGPTFCL